MRLPGLEYTRAFYAKREQGSLLSARAVLPFLVDVVRPRSIADFGCGTGTWLSVAKSLGVERVHGIEGKWVERAKHLMAPGELSTRDLNEPVRLASPVDLAISLEVAEHLRPERAPGFIADLCAASSVVLFGAATPAQGGTGHVNEQWQSYWAGLFAARGYECLDIVRPKFWSTSDVLPWYKQNALLYATPAARKGFEERIPAELLRAKPPLDVVHPDMYTRLFRDPPLRLGVRVGLEVAQKVLRMALPFDALRGG
jgi:hypothetical protein